MTDQTDRMWQSVPDHTTCAIPKIWTEQALTDLPVDRPAWMDGWTIQSNKPHPRHTISPVASCCQHCIVHCARHRAVTVAPTINATRLLAPATACAVGQQTPCVSYSLCSWLGSWRRLVPSQDLEELRRCCSTGAHYRQLTSSHQ